MGATPKPHLGLHFLPLLQIQPILVGFLIPVEFLQLLGQRGGSLAGLLLQPVILLHLRGRQTGLKGGPQNFRMPRDEPYLVLLQRQVAALALALLLHALLEFLPGFLHREHLLLQLVHVPLAFFVLFLGVLQRFFGRLQLLDLVRGVLLRLDVLRALLVQLRVLLPAGTGLGHHGEGSQEVSGGLLAHFGGFLARFGGVWGQIGELLACLGGSRPSSGGSWLVFGGFGVKSGSSQTVWGVLNPF